MNALMRIRALVMLCCLAAMITAGLALLSTTEVRAARCCWVMVCDNHGCYEKCVTCPKFP